MDVFSLVKEIMDIVKNKSLEKRVTATALDIAMDWEEELELEEEIERILKELGFAKVKDTAEQRSWQLCNCKECFTVSLESVDNTIEIREEKLGCVCNKEQN